MSEISHIRLMQGFCSLNFGGTPQEAKTLFGEPKEENLLRDEIFEHETLVYYYEKGAFSLFFEKKPEAKFSSVECEDPSTLLNGEPVFAFNEKELINFLKQLGYALSEIELHPWGEKCLNFDEAGLSCYFQNKKLKALTFSGRPL